MTEKYKISDRIFWFFLFLWMLYSGVSGFGWLQLPPWISWIVFVSLGLATLLSLLIKEKKRVGK